MRTLKWMMVVLLAVSSPLRAEDSEWAALNAAVLTQAQAGELDVAKKSGEQAVEVARREFGTEDRRTADSLALLGEVLMLLEDWKQAKVVLAEATAIRIRVLRPGEPDLEQSDNLMSRVHVAQGNFDEAERLQLKSLAAAEKAAAAGEMGPKAPRWTDVIASLGQLSGFYAQRENQARARAMRKRAVEVLARYAKDEEDHLSRLGTLVDEASNAGDYVDAEVLARERLRLSEKEQGTQPYQYALALRQLADLRLLQDDSSGSNQLHDQALAAAEKALKPDDPRLAPFLGDAGYLDFESMSFDRAESRHKRALALYDASGEPETAMYLLSASRLALIYKMRNQHQLAEPWLRKIIEIRKKQSGPDDAGVYDAELDLAENLFEQRKWAEAGAQFRSLQAVRAGARQPLDLRQIPGLRRMVETWVRIGDHGAAAQAWRSVVELRRQRYGERDARVVAGYLDLAALQRIGGDAAAAVDSERRAKSAEGTGTQDAPAKGDALPEFLQAMFDQSLLDMLTPVLEEIEQVPDAGAAVDAALLASTIELRGELHLTSANVALAAGEYEKALSIRLRGSGKSSEAAQRSAGRLAELYRKLGKADLARDALKRAAAN